MGRGTQMSTGSRNVSSVGHATRLSRRGATSAAAARKPAVYTLGRAGFVARGLVYFVVAWIALMIAINHRANEADRTGALEVIAGKPFGFVLLWFLVVGFAGMALWRAMLAVRPDQPGKKGAGSRLASAGKAVLYAAATYTTARFTITGHAGTSTNQQSADFTTGLMQHDGGRWLIGVVGIGVVIVGLFFIKRGLKKDFMKNLETGSMSAVARRRVLLVGTIGNAARGVITVGAGVFLIDAAVKFDPAQARGVDGTLRALGSAPLGPVILVAMALGLAAFGAYSFCEARWRRL